MKAYFRALSSHSSAMMVYLSKCFTIHPDFAPSPCSDTDGEKTCAKSSEDEERPVMVSNMEGDQPESVKGDHIQENMWVTNLQRRKVKLVMWKIGFLPHLSTSWPNVRELMMVPT